MKKSFLWTIAIASLLLIGAALWQLVVLVVLPLIQTNAARQTPMALFADFPVNQVRVVNLDWDQDSRGHLTLREQQDQFRDWLLFTVVSTANLPIDQFNASLYDLPAVRGGYTQPLSNLEYGSTRSLYVGAGQVVALLPAELPQAERRDMLGQIADEHRKNTGEKPTTVHIFDYQLDTDYAHAQVTRREPLDAVTLFTDVYGYAEVQITTRDDLQRFLQQMDDVTFASVTPNGLLLGGRKYSTRQYRPLRVEDVAVLWQSERHNGGASSGLAGFSATPESGFSLDPVYDFDGLVGYFATQESALQQLAAQPGSSVTTKVIREAKLGLQNHDIVPLLTLIENLTEEEQRRLSAGELPYYVAKLHQDVEEKVNVQYQYQTARYEGDLQGTEVGMTLFYTDLLAKLWVMDYLGSATGAKIPDFRSLTKTEVSRVYEQEIRRLSHTRLWFGQLARGFQQAGNGDVLFLAHNATRVYAASSNPLTPGKEENAAAHSEAFLGWWNDHYQEIARYEPEYQRLNQIMKWSLLVSWLEAADKSNRLGFLSQVPVEHDRWFPTWVKQHPDLKFHDWDKVGFYPKGYLGTMTEAMQTLASGSFLRFGYRRIVSGGVSLASKSLFEGRSVLSRGISDLLRRPTLDYGTTPFALDSQTLLGGLRLRALEGGEYEIKALTTSRASVSSILKSGLKIRNRIGETASDYMTRILVKTGDGVQLETRIGDMEVAKVQISRAEQALTVGYQSRELDLAQMLARRVSESGWPEYALAKQSQVESFVKLADDNQFLIKMRGSNRLLKLTEEKGPGSSIESGSTPRFAGASGKSRVMQVAWVEPDRLPAELGTRGSIIMEPFENSTAMFLRNDPIRGPPGQGIKVQVDSGLGTLQAQLDPKTGRLYFAKESLPQALRDDPTQLSSLVRESDLAAIRQQAAHSGASIQYMLPADRWALADRLRGDLEAGAHEDVARQLAADPVHVKLYLDGYLHDQVEQAYALVDNGNFTEAFLRFDHLTQPFGERWELLLHKGLAYMKRGDKTRAAESLNAIRVNDTDTLPMFLDEITRHFPNSALAEQEALDQHVVEQFFEWRSLVARGEVPPVEVQLRASDVGFAVEAGLGDGLAGSPVSATEVRSTALIYLQDGPQSAGLNNLDWSISAPRALQQALEGKLVDVTELHRTDVAHFNPTRIYTADGTTFRQVGETGERRIIPWVYVPSHPSNNQDDEQSRRPVYLVRLRGGNGQ